MFLIIVGVNMGRSVETWLGLEPTGAVEDALMMFFAATLRNGELEAVV